MLVTTCPECDTTFRVTAGVLDQASGQVRCGRCGHIFDANTALREHADTETRRIGTAETATPAPVPDSALESEQDDTAESGAPLAGSSESNAAGWYLADAPPFDELAEEPPADAGEPAEEPELGSDAGPGPAAEEDAAAAGTGAPEADGGTEPPTRERQPTPDWLPSPAAPLRRRWPWTAAAVLLVLALVAQLAHRFRAELVAVPALAGPLQTLYSMLGREPPVRLDLDRYRLLDLTAVAEPVSGEQGWLVIETRVQNTGPVAQPVPHIFVALLDRWQETIAGRYFSPAEYAVGNLGDLARMPSGSTVDAQFIIVDPGPEAIGFELQLCAPAGESFLCDGNALYE